jgi:arylsulfatase A-like enzyme
MMTGPDSSLLVVTVDRLPAWMLSAYGATWVSTPACDAAAARGLVLDRLIATGDTLGMLLEGVVAPLAGVFSSAEVTVVTDDETVADVFPGAANRLEHVPIHAPDKTAPDEAATNLGRLFATAAGTVSAGRRQMLWCHAASLGTAWDAPVRYREAYVDPDDPPPPAGGCVPEFVVSAETDPDRVMAARQVFAGQLTLFDRCLGGLLATVRQGGAWTVLIAGVRGLPLGLHGRVGLGGLPPYGEITHVPAILIDAAGRMAGQRYDGLVTHADLGVTLRELCGGPPKATAGEPALAMSPATGPGMSPAMSIAGLFPSWSAPRRDRIVVCGSAGTAIVTPGWHLVVPAAAALEDGGRPRLFAKPDDFFEVCDVADRSGGVADELTALAAAARAGDLATAWGRPLSHAAVAGGAV